MALVSVKFADGDVKALAELTVLDFKTYMDIENKKSAICYRSMLLSVCGVFHASRVNIHRHPHQGSMPHKYTMLVDDDALCAMRARIVS